MKCLCCNKEIVSPDEYEKQVSWHSKCIKKFFGTEKIPELDCSEEEIEKLANSTVSKGLTVPGVQKKLSLHLETVDHVDRLTLVDYPTGYIMKPQSSDFQALPEAEFLSMKLAEIAGIKTVPCALLHNDHNYIYITKRVDRIKNKMKAMEDFCQLSGRPTADKYKGSYESCGKIIKNFSKNVGIDMSEFYYRLLFCFITGNSDMHLKNFSLIESKPGSRVFGLSEAYDLLPVNIILPEDQEQTALTLNGKKRNIRKKDFHALASSLDVSEKTSDALTKRLISLEKKFIETTQGSNLPKEMQTAFIELMDSRIAIFK